MQCPHCSKSKCVPDVVCRNAEIYGGSIYHVFCIHCRKLIRVTARRKVVITHIEISDKKPSEADFNYRDC